MSHERKFSRRDFAKLFGVGGLLFLASCAPKIPPKETVSPLPKNTETPSLLPSKTPTLTKTSTLTVTRTEAVPTKEDERKIPPPKMMVLGDSITKFGFADYLSEALNEEGYQVEFVGSNISNKNVKNEGHGGFSTIEIERDLEDGFWSWGEQKLQPIWMKIFPIFLFLSWELMMPQVDLIPKKLPSLILERSLPFSEVKNLRLRLLFFQ